MRGFRILFSAGIGLLAGFCATACTGVSKELACQSSAECVRGDDQGQCMPPGFCAFSDGTCPSGFRWDPTAAADLAGLCVEDGDADAGAGIDAGTVQNTCGGTTPLAGAPGSACGICDSGTYQCAGPEAVECQGALTLDQNITALGTAAAETEFPGGNFPAELSVDTDLSTSWFSDGPDGDGTPTFYRWDRGTEECIAQIQFVGNGAHSNTQFRTTFGFGQVTIRVLDAGDNPVFSEIHDLDANPNVPDPNLNIDTGGVVGQTVELLFSGHESPDCGGFAELAITAKR